MARSYGQLGRLAQDRGDHAQAQQEYSRALAIREQLGDQHGMATIHHNLGTVAQMLGDHDEAEHQYRQAINISERIGDQATTAATYAMLGALAYKRRNHHEAERHYRRSIDISERLGNQAQMAAVYSQLGILETDRGGSAVRAITWHVQALAIGLQRGTAQEDSVRHLAMIRGELGPDRFCVLLANATGDTDQAEKITALLDQLDAADRDRR